MSKRKRDLAQPEPPPPAPPYEPNERERAVLDAYRDRSQARPERVGMKVVEISKGAVSLAPDHADLAVGTAALCSSTGSGSMAFAHSLVDSLAQATAKGGKAQEAGLNNAPALVQALQP